MAHMRTKKQIMCFGEEDEREKKRFLQVGKVLQGVRMHILEMVVEAEAAADARTLARQGKH